MTYPISRYHEPQQVTIAASAALSSAVYIGPGAGVLVHMPAAWTAADLGVQVSPSEDGTYQALWIPNSDHTANIQVKVPLPTAALSYSFPAGVFPAGWLKFWSCTSAEDTVQEADRAFWIEVKG